MRRYSLDRRRFASALAGIAAGCALAVLVATVAATAVARQSTTGARAVFDATHLPPLLTLPGERVPLVYDVHCSPDGIEDPERACAVGGTVHLRTGAHGPFRALQLERSSNDGIRQLTATVPREIAASSDGFQYYAEFRVAGSDELLLVPGGGADAPQRSLPLLDPTEVALGVHMFGAARRGARLVSTTWGEGPASVGLEPGRNLPAIGATAFDVDDDGSVLVLDEAHRRALRWGRDGSGPARVALAIDGRLADMALGDDGSIYVLESVAAPGRTPLVRRFDARGRALGAVETAEREPAQLQMGTNGPVVLQRPSQQWMPVTEADEAVQPPEQRRRATAGRPVRSGGEVVVVRRNDQILAALVSDGRVQRSWTVTSETALAEIQLAEPIGRRLLLIVRTYTDSADEFVVLVLDRDGIVTEFSTPTDEWAEAAPLARFRYADSRLYRLGSDSSGVFVDRYAIGAS